MPHSTVGCRIALHPGFSAGGYHTAFLRSDGAVVACSCNDGCQCDIPPLDEGISYVQVSTGTHHTLLLRSDGRAVACGQNDNGQCNLPQPRGKTRYTQVPK